MRLALLALSMTLLVSAQRPEEPYIVPLDPVIDATIDGKPVRLRVDPGSPTMPLLNPEAVARLGLRAGPQAGTGIVGSLRFTGRTGVARLRLPGDRRPRKTRVIWFDRPNAAGVDGEINPTLLPYQRVRFLRPGRGGVLRSLPYQDTGNRSLGIRLTLAGERVDVSFGLGRNGGSATADAGRLLAIAHGGSLAPGVQGEMEVGLGVRRPFRELRLERPIQVGPFALGRIRVRTATAAALGLSEPGGDPDEVVVTASNRSPNREIRIKADELDRCAWVEVDRRAGRITFNCPD
jgi:hypothetical protein